MCLCRICTQGTPPFKDLPSWSISNLSIPGAMKIKIRKMGVFFLQERGERGTKMQKEKTNCQEKDRAQEAKSWSWSHHPEEEGKIFSLTPPYFGAAPWRCWHRQEWPIRGLCRDQQSDSHVTSPRKPHESASSYLFVGFSVIEKKKKKYHHPPKINPNILILVLWSQVFYFWISRGQLPQNKRHLVSPLPRDGVSIPFSSSVVGLCFISISRHLKGSSKATFPFRKKKKKTNKPDMLLKDFCFPELLDPLTSLLRF